jgi:DNA-binding transcriptional regulator YhcF (GntR family)
MQIAAACPAVPRFDRASPEAYTLTPDMPRRRGAITTALRQRVVAGLHLSVLKQGDRLPSVRTLALELDADPRVVLAAYRQLEVEGLVEVRARSGSYVAQTVVSASEMLPQTAGWVVDVLVQALSRGVPAIEFPERVRRCLETLRLRTVCIECNTDQIADLCEELRRDYGLDTSGVDTATLKAEEVPYEVRRADLLVTTRFHAGDVQRLAERLEKPWIVVSLRTDFLTETARLLEQGPVYFVATDPRFADKLRLTFASTAHSDNLRPLIVGRDDLAQIPEGAPTYVMQAARAELGDLPLLTRVIPAPRVFSSDSARELLSFIVRSNLAAIAAQEARS